MWLADFHFLRPLWLVALPVLALLLYRLRRSQESGGWDSFCEPELLPQLLEGSVRRDVSRTRWTGLAGAIAILALAGPTWERLPQAAYRDAQALVIALDLSRSMQAMDLAPSRLQQARFRLDDLLRQRPGQQTGLLVYGGHPFVITPITHDSETLRTQLRALRSDIMPAPGSRPAPALEQAMRLLEDGGFQHGEVLLVGDDAGGQEALRAARKLAHRGFQVSVLGTGTAEGAPIPRPRGGFLVNPAGDYINARLDEAALRKLAAAGGGRYRRLQPASDPQELLDFLATPSALAEHREQTRFQAAQWRDLGPWLLWLLLPLVLMTFRRSTVIAGCCLLLLSWAAPVPTQAQGWKWRDLWVRTDQQGQQALETGHAEEAAALFKDPAWRATALYRAEKYAQAIEALEDLDDPESHFLRGNAKARQGQLQAAVQTYRKVLEQAPNHLDARHNLDLVEKLLRQQKVTRPPPPQEENTATSDDQSTQGNARPSPDSASPPKQRQHPTQDEAADEAATASTQSPQPDATQSEAAADPTPTQRQDPTQDGAADEAATASTQSPQPNATQSEAAMASTPAQRQDPTQDGAADEAAMASTQPPQPGATQSKETAASTPAPQPGSVQKESAMEETGNAAMEQQHFLQSQLQSIEEAPATYLRRKFQRDYRILLEQGRIDAKDTKSW